MLNRGPPSARTHGPRTVAESGTCQLLSESSFLSPGTGGSTPHATTKDKPTEEDMIIRPDILIGIDPDVDRNGAALLDIHQRKLEISTLAFPDLIDYILYQQRAAEVQGRILKVVVEAGWMNQGNWHLRNSDTKAVAVAKGVHQGRNEQVSRLIGEMCAHYRVQYEFIRPLRKIWKGENGKITHEELAYFTGIHGRTNQEGRDAALIAWTYAGLPVRVKVGR